MNAIDISSNWPTSGVTMPLSSFCLLSLSGVTMCLQGLAAMATSDSFKTYPHSIIDDDNDYPNETSHRRNVIRTIVDVSTVSRLLFVLLRQSHQRTEQEQPPLTSPQVISNSLYSIGKIGLTWESLAHCKSAHLFRRNDERREIEDSNSENKRDNDDGAAEISMTAAEAVGELISVAAANMKPQNIANTFVGEHL
jgi:hypothetical protein